MDNPIKTDFSCNLAEEWKLNKGITQAQPEVPAEGQWAGMHVGHSQAAPPAVSAECGAGVGRRVPALCRQGPFSASTQGAAYAPSIGWELILHLLSPVNLFIYLFFQLKQLTIFTRFSEIETKSLGIL